MGNVSAVGLVAGSRTSGVSVVNRPRQARFETLFETTYGPVLAYARRRVDEDLAADVASATFEVAWRRLDAVPAEPLPWLYGVARRQLANAWRSDRRRLRLRGRLATTFAFDPTVEPGLEAASARAALARLREDDREVLMLVAWEGLGSEDAARSLGISVSAFEVRLHRARRRLEKELP